MEPLTPEKVQEAPECDRSVAFELPWGTFRRPVPSPVVDVEMKPGDFVAQTLLVELMLMTEKKISLVIEEPLEKPLNKVFQKGEDVRFDQVISTIGLIGENCLPSVVKIMLEWYDKQQKQLYEMICKKLYQNQPVQVKSEGTKTNSKSDAKSEKEYLLEKCKLAVDYVLCLVLIDVLKQLTLHPRIDDLVNQIIYMAFSHFRFSDYSQFMVNSTNVLIVSDLYAEVVGVLSASRFYLVRKKFMQELADLRSKENIPWISQSIVNLLMGMKFFRVKMVPIEDFEACLSFLHELGTYFIEVKVRDIKHALAGLFIEILLPMAASVKTEVNVPSVKSFVDLLYSHTLDLVTKKKHSLAFFPLLTCLLCISHKQFFLNNWHYFLTLCLSNLKNKGPKMSRVAVESLYRLVWVYVIRVKCESNTATQSCLQSICTSLFPKGGRGVVPRDTPLNIFVKILHFIAQERLDFAFKEVIFDLLCVGRPIRTLYPERMNVGLRALLVIADSLQRREGPPPLPRTIGILPSGNTLRVRKTYLFKPLITDVARSIGIDLYYGPCRRAFDGILRLLDLQVGQPLMSTVIQTSGKESEDLLGGERKPKLDLFRTCIAAVPRILPDGMPRQELVGLISRLTVHVDDELRGLACQTLQNFITECPAWREDVMFGFVEFVSKEILDPFPDLLDNTVRLLLQLLCCWKSSVNAIVPPSAPHQREPLPEVAVKTSGGIFTPVLRGDGSSIVLHSIEGLALTLLCQNRSTPRKLAITILKEVKNILPLLCPDEASDKPVIDVLDAACRYVMRKYMQYISDAEKTYLLSSKQVDVLWVSERMSTIEIDPNLINLENGNEYFQWDPWAVILSGFTEQQTLLVECPTAVSYAWPAIHTRLSTVFPYVDPSNPQNDTRGSLLRSSKSKSFAMNCGETLTYSNYLGLWQKYIVFAFALAPLPQQGTAVLLRNVSPMMLQSDSNETGKTIEVRIPHVNSVSVSNLFRLVLPFIRSDLKDIRDSMVVGLGSVNSNAFESLIDELSPYIREACERKQENIRRRKRRDLLRLQLIRVFEFAVFRGSALNSAFYDSISGSLKPFFQDFIGSCRLFLESDTDRDSQQTHALRIHFAKMIILFIKSFSLEKRSELMTRELRKNLFYLFASWSGRLGLVLDRRQPRDKDLLNSEEYFAVTAMCAVLTCGNVFDANAISDENGYIYGWIDALLKSQNEQISLVSEETLVLLLEYNSDCTSLLDWVIDNCICATSAVADKCFRALAFVISSREYPCDFISVLNICLIYAGYSVVQFRELAIRLLHILHQRFFDKSATIFGIELVAAIDREKEDAATAPPVCDQPPSELYLAKSQLYISTRLSEMHPELTIPIISEVFHRLKGARAPIRDAMLSYVIPWLYNVELVDPNIEAMDVNISASLSLRRSEQQAASRRPLKGTGWGCTQATELVLNNLMYVTAKLEKEHCISVESLWVALVAYWPVNLPVIMRYLFIMSMLSPDVFLLTAKRVITYLAKVRTERLIFSLMNELQCIETFRFIVERSELPPFYRLAKRGEDFEDAPTVTPSKRASESDKDEIKAPDDLYSDSSDEMDSLGSLTSLVTLKAEAPNITEKETKISSPQENVHPFQLPMPAYGGYYCPLDELLNSSHTVVFFYRSHIAIMFLTDLVLAEVNVEWVLHLPQLLHFAVLGLDHNRPIVQDHCKQLIINLLLIFSGEAVAKDILRLLTTAAKNDQFLLSEHLFCDQASMGSSDSLLEKVGDAGNLLNSFVRNANVHDLVVRLVEFLLAKKGVPLWSYEDITPRNVRIPSVETLTSFVINLNNVFCLLVSTACVDGRWPQTALNIALSCSNRHYAGRSFQILRAFHVPLSSSMITGILSRLVETVSERNEDMQGYVTEIMLTLESSILHIEVAEHSLANLFKETMAEKRAGSAVSGGGRSSPTHQRSTSCFIGVLKSGSPAAAADTAAIVLQDMASSSGVSEGVESTAVASMARSKSAHALKGEGKDEHVASLSQLLWIATSLLDSDFEHEFLMATRMLDRLLDLPVAERADCFDRLSRMLAQLNWPNFPGIQKLALKGVTFANAFEVTASVLVKSVPLLRFKIIEASQKDGFASTVIALLPMLLLHYNSPTRLCLSAAENIAKFCREELKGGAPPSSSSSDGDCPLEHLATVMRLYYQGSFSKEGLQWTKCVVKYLDDAYPSSVADLLPLLAEMMEKGPAGMYPALLEVIYCVLHFVDFSRANKYIINGDVLRLISQHVEGQHWNNASKIAKLTVARSSNFALPCAATESVNDDEDVVKKGLPGRTMDFTMDLSFLWYSPPELSRMVFGSNGFLKAAPGSENSTTRRSAATQVKVRAHLVNLLNTSGLHIGLLKTPSIIFSQSSHEAGFEQQSSAYSSNAELANSGDHASNPSPDHLAGTDTGSEKFPPVFKEFDFLEGEQDSVSESGESCFHWLSTLRPEAICGAADEDTSEAVTTAVNLQRDRSGLNSSSHASSESDISDEVTLSFSDEFQNDPYSTVLSPAFESNLSLLEETGDACSTPELENIFSLPFSSEELDSMEVSADGPDGGSEISSAIAQRWCMFNLECSHHSTGQIEETWAKSISQILSDDNYALLARAQLVFSQLIRETGTKMYSLVRDACHFLTMTDSFNGVASALLEAGDILLRLPEFPFVFVADTLYEPTENAIRQKYYLLELKEHHEAFQEKREQTIKLLNSVKSSLRLKVFENAMEHSTVEQEHELCQNLNKLFFQLYLMLECFAKIVQFDLSLDSQENLSSDIAVFHRDLLCAVNEIANCSEHKTLPEGSVSRKRLQHALANKRSKECILQLRSLRMLHGRTEALGCCEEEDIELLLLVYCQMLAVGDRKLLVIIGSESFFGDICRTLMETYVTLCTRLRSPAPPFRHGHKSCASNKS